jgi:hypothetical protein
MLLVDTVLSLAADGETDTVIDRRKIVTEPAFSDELTGVTHCTSGMQAQNRYVGRIQK